MDTALILKQKFDAGEISSFSEASDYLNESEIITALLSDFDFDSLNLLNRLTEISEIPFAYKLERVQKWINLLADLSFCGDGFSITGKREDLLSCYNSMITSLLIRMNYSNSERIERGLEWILHYQNLKRNIQSNWDGSRALKYGGCMKKTPCYIGVVKATIALSDYKKHTKYRVNESIDYKLKIGLEYILDHQLYLRQSDGQPITKDISTLIYPFSYKTNVIEILRLMKDNNLHLDARCELAKAYLEGKKQKDGYWKIRSSYLPKCWIKFDKAKEPGMWISYEIEKLLKSDN